MKFETNGKEYKGGLTHFIILIKTKLPGSDFMRLPPFYHNLVRALLHI